MRNALIGVCFTLAVLAMAGSARAGDDGFTPLFDGKSLNGWDGDPQFWRVEEGLITGETTADKPTKSNTFLIWRGGDVGDFELVFDFRFQSDWGNSGVQYRSFQDPEKWGKWAVGGYQADFDSGNTYTGILYGERYRGILGPRGTKSVIGANHKSTIVETFADGKQLGETIKKNDWNTFRVVAQGFHFTHEINGKLMSDTTDDDAEMRRATGILALQLHAGKPMKIQFRNIRLKRAAAPAPGQASAMPAAEELSYTSAASGQPAKKVLFIAGRPSHGYMQHEHYAGCALLAKALNENVPGISCTAVRGWPSDAAAFDGVAAVVIFSDGGGGHPVCAHLAEMDALAKKGVGLACLHYAVEVPKGEPGDRMLSWIGGYFETFWSVNPHWTGEFKSFPEHAVTRGVKPFTVDDEWYYHMRFVPDMKGVTAVLTTIPPDSTRREGNDAHGANEHVRARKGMPEHLGWVYTRPDGGRGFGFTGGHWHYNWANDGFRTLVLNAIVWTAGRDVPAGGVRSKAPTMEELEVNLDDKPSRGKFDREKAVKLLEEWKAAK
jgi:hypothetical protein